MTHQSKVVDVIIGFMDGAKKVEGLGQIEVIMSGQDLVRPFQGLGQDVHRGLCPPSRTRTHQTRIKRQGAQETRHGEGILLPLRLQAAIVIAPSWINRRTGFRVTDQGELQARHDE